jgi:phosphatidylglycerophosphatase A
MKSRTTTLADRLALLWGTGFGTGYSPLVSGTVGTLVGIPLYLLLHRFTFGLFGPAVGLTLYLTVTAVLFMAGVVAANRLEARFRTRDPSQVTADEVVGYLVAACAISPSLASVAVTFALFRIFDIIKPFPARRSERLPGGWGIMVDDLWAGLYANLAARVCLYIWGLVSQ